MSFVRTLPYWLCDLHQWAGVWGCHPAHTNTLDRSRRNRVGGACDLDGRQSHAPKGSERPVGVDNIYRNTAKRFACGGHPNQADVGFD
jgi:hypothetical protein